MEILSEIYKIIAERAEHPQEGSYTNHLLKEGLDEVCKKIGEEAAETIISAKNENKREVINEVADLYYHTLVLLYVKGITLEDIEQELQGRFLKGGFHGRTE
jgi:phosphoribosyl-ATP pyrophosphohydrolase